MRITGGLWAGRPLKVPPGQGVRPTPDKVRQAIFNSLGYWVAGQSVLELFAGSGALSLECLSRGATRAVCVELSRRHAGVLRGNLQSLEADAGVRVQDAFVAARQLAEHGEQFDFIVADPPYGEKNTGRRSESLAQRLLDDENMPRILKADGRLLLGHARRDQLDVAPPWSDLKVLKHGDNWIRMLEILTEESYEPKG
ncbi:MAG: 16S rRNA (guanine(966)-N(2))-methyltransferase RsmD [Verrucomicrobiales bacterium]|nr:16S rRNA (guanine(966)-N(2))-methyltransferase RsmD [Verrucomicrobiales bacterium]|tara:strand:+ start:592 stop:1185 length:594 start_codon:yes stop_codon:yes gene_type:complete